MFLTPSGAVNGFGSGMFGINGFVATVALVRGARGIKTCSNSEFPSWRSTERHDPLGG